jgi:bleomycin hydrolase
MKKFILTLLILFPIALTICAQNGNLDSQTIKSLREDYSKKSQNDSGSSHAMLLMACDTDTDDNPVKWQFENSWGSAYGHNGYLTLTDEWFNEYMFRVVVNKKYLNEKTLKLLEQKSIMLPPWDPMFISDN